MNISGPDMPEAIPDELAGRNTIVTGAGHGMGGAIATRLAKAGASVVVNDLASDTASDTTQSVVADGGKAITVAGDVSDSTFVDFLIDRTVSEFGHINILATAAGILRRTGVWIWMRTSGIWSRT